MRVSEDVLEIYMVELSQRDATRREHPPLQDYGECYLIYRITSRSLIDFRQRTSPVDRRNPDGDNR